MAYPKLDPQKNQATFFRFLILIFVVEIKLCQELLWTMDGKKIGRQYSERRDSLELAKAPRKMPNVATPALPRLPLRSKKPKGAFDVIIEDEDSSEMIMRALSNDTLAFIEDAHSLRINRNSDLNRTSMSFNRTSMSDNRTSLNSLKSTISGISQISTASSNNWTAGCAGHPVWGENLLVE